MAIIIFILLIICIKTHDEWTTNSATGNGGCSKNGYKAYNDDLEKDPKQAAKNYFNGKYKNL